MVGVSERFKCILHGSFNKKFSEIKKIYRLFTEAGIEVIAPQKLFITSQNDNFARFSGEENLDKRYIELLYLNKLNKLGDFGFSYFVNPDGYLGKSASYELGIAQATNVKCFFYEKLDDLPAYIHKNSIFKPQDLIEYIKRNNSLPSVKFNKSESAIHRLWEELIVPGSIVAAGGIIEYESKNLKEREILLVKTHKWGGRFSIIGGKVRRNELLAKALVREVKEETGLRGELGRHICTFDQIKNSGYYMGGIQHIFVDNVVSVKSRKVYLNDEAQDFLWIDPIEALEKLDIEPNARHTIDLYVKSLSEYSSNT